MFSPIFFLSFVIDQTYVDWYKDGQILFQLLVRVLLSFSLYCKTVSVFCGYFINHCHLRCLCFIASNTQVGFQHPALFVRKQIHQRVIYLQKSTSMESVVSGFNIRIKTEHCVVIFNMLLYFLTFISLYTLFLLTLIKKKFLKNCEEYPSIALRQFIFWKKNDLQKTVT